MYESGNRTKDHPVDAYPVQYSCSGLPVWTGSHYSGSFDDGKMDIVSPDCTNGHLAVERTSGKEVGEK